MLRRPPADLHVRRLRGRYGGDAAGLIHHGRVDPVRVERHRVQRVGTRPEADRAARGEAQRPAGEQVAEGPGGPRLHGHAVHAQPWSEAAPQRQVRLRVGPDLRDLRDRDVGDLRRLLGEPQCQPRRPHRRDLQHAVGADHALAPLGVIALDADLQQARRARWPLDRDLPHHGRAPPRQGQGRVGVAGGRYPGGGRVAVEGRARHARGLAGRGGAGRHGEAG
ncbi:MAG: hypothetical protein ACRDP6_29625, partial [Actinoallomurus sp.]